MAAFTNPTDPASIVGQINDTTTGVEIRDSKGNLNIIPSAWPGHHKDDGTEVTDTGRLEVDDIYKRDKDERSITPVNKTTVSNSRTLTGYITTDMLAGKEASTRARTERRTRSST